MIGPGDGLDADKVGVKDYRQIENGNIRTRLSIFILFYLNLFYAKLFSAYQMQSVLLGILMASSMKEVDNRIYNLPLCLCRRTFKYRQCVSFPIEESETVTTQPHTYMFTHKHTCKPVYVYYRFIFKFEVFLHHIHISIIYVLQGH